MVVEPEPQGGLEMDNEHAMLLLERTHMVLALVLQRKLPKQLHSDVAHLFRDVDAALSYFSVH